MRGDSCRSPAEYSNASLIEIISDLEKTYPVKFFFNPSELPKEPINASIVQETALTAVNNLVDDFGLRAVQYDNYTIIIARKEFIEQNFTPAFYNAVSNYGKTVLQTSQVTDGIIIGDSTALNASGSATIQGMVTDQATGEPVIGSTIFLEDRGVGTTTDAAGEFKLDLPIGIYKVRLKSVGYLDLSQKIIVKSDGKLSLNVSKDFVILDEIVISASRAEETLNKSITGLVAISPKRIKEIPTFMGEPDLIGSLMFLPGVSKLGEGALGFNVRGGNTDENLVTFDEVALFNSNHALGFFGSINTDIIKSANLYKGIVPAQFGGRLSSVLDVDSKSGDNENFKMGGGIGPLYGKLTLEVPVIKGKSSLLAAGRSSYSDWLLQRVNVPEVKNSSVFFYDVNLNYLHHFNDKFIIRGSFYLSRDEFRSADLFGLDYGTNSFSLKISNQITERLASTLTLTYSDYFSTKTELSGNEASEFDTGIAYYKVKEYLEYQLSEQLKIDLGGSLIYHASNPGQIHPTNDVSVVASKSLEEQNALETAGFLSMEYQINKNFVLSAGLRGSFYSLLGPGKEFVYQDPNNPTYGTITDTLIFDSGKKIASYSTLEPRLSLNIIFNEYRTLKFGYSRMAQYLFQISNTAAVTPVDVWMLSNAYLAPPRAHNFSLTMMRDSYTREWRASLGGFYRSFTDIKEYKDFADLIVNPHLETEIIEVDGKAYGLELGLDKTLGKLTGNLAYTLSRSERRSKGSEPSTTINNGEWYPANYDKTHDLSITTNYKFNKRHSFAVSFIYNTGRPITAPLGFFDVDRTTRVPIYSSRNELRIPDYHRLDISYSLGQGHRKTKRWKSSWTFGIYNLYGRRNPYSVFFTQAPLSGLKANKYSVLGSAIPTITYNFNYQ